MQTLQHHNSLADWARELFKPSMDLASLLQYLRLSFFSFRVWAGWVTSKWEHVFTFLAKFTWPWAPTQRAIFWSCFFGNYAKIQVSRTIDWLSSISGAKSMSQRPNLWQKLKSSMQGKFAPSVQILASHNSAAGWAKELFKPFKEMWRLVVYNEKKKFKV